MISEEKVRQKFNIIMIKISTIGIEPSKEYEARILSSGNPDFIKYEQDCGEIVRLLEPFQKFSKIIVIGHGGSVTTFMVYLRALKGNGKKVFILNTNEPDLIYNLKKDYLPIDTVVVCVSKSGENITNLEAVLQFRDYKVIVVTQNNDNALRKIANYYKWLVIDHPPIGGRFSGFTSSAFVPAQLFGLQINKIISGAKNIYKLGCVESLPEKNIAWQIASCLHRLDLVGKDEIFLSLYSYYLETSVPLITQLVHETLGKNMRGFTLVGAVAPEAQHHTNQRFFGGKKNMVGLFVTVKEQRHYEIANDIPLQLQDIKLKNDSLADINKISLSKALESEFIGTKNDAINNKIPLLHIELEKIDSENIGEFIALWQLIVYYLAILINVDPFSQPEVENSKVISFQYRKEFSHIDI